MVNSLALTIVERNRARHKAEIILSHWHYGGHQDETWESSIPWIIKDIELHGHFDWCTAKKLYR